MKKDCVVIFDLDGTLLNTDELIRCSFEYVFKHYRPDYTLSKEEYLSFLGPKLRDSFARYFPEEMLDELIACYREYNHTHHEDYVSVYPTVIETLEYLKNQGYPLAVLTTKIHEAALIGLDLFDMTKYFDVIIGSDQIEKGKPNPLGIHRIMSDTHCQKAVMIGDNVSDILTGKNANVYTIGVKWTPKGTKEIEKLNPDLMVGQMSEIIQLIERIGK